jgi:hypothetical protein
MDEPFPWNRDFIEGMRAYELFAREPRRATLAQKKAVAVSRYGFQELLNVA